MARTVGDASFGCHSSMSSETRAWNSRVPLPTTLLSPSDTALFLPTPINRVNTKAEKCSSVLRQVRWQGDNEALGKTLVPEIGF